MAKTKNKIKTFEEAVEILSNLGFKQDTEYIKTTKTCLVRFTKGDSFALVSKEKTKKNFVITYGHTWHLSSAPKTAGKGKPGPKPSSDPKKKIVVFIEESKIEKLGGDVAVRQLFYDTATEKCKPVEIPDNSGSMQSGDNYDNYGRK